jgi:EAL domain-containing protein (putative c-di-GMP-specific phosphodiesterase class I)
VSIAASYRTAKQSGGDYYDVIELPDGRLGFLIADVSGKGAPAAVLMAVVRTIVHETARSRVTGPATLLDYADTRLCTLGLPQRGAFTTAFSCALDPATGALTYSSAGHNPPRLLRVRQRTILPLDGAGATPLGMLDKPCAHTEETVVLMPGDLAVLYTDGLTEAMSPEGEFFGTARLDEILRALPEPVTPALAVEAIARAVGEFTGTESLSDDQTLLVLGRRAQSGEPANAAADPCDIVSQTTEVDRAASHETITIMPALPDLRSLIEGSTAFFQPIVDLNTGQILGAETLVRFINPDGTLRGPSGIIERIEENLDDLEVFTWHLFRSIAKRTGPLLDRHRHFYISINIPPVILGSPRLKQIFEDSGLIPYIDRIVCEITERQALTDFGREALAIVRPMGLRIAMDDFGTGQSGLKQLIGLPLDILKIDKSQVAPLMKEPTADRLLRGVVALAAAMRVKVVAEGVETREQAFFLQAAGVDAGQGWLWSKAVPPDELERLITSGFSEHRRWK